MRRTKIVCTIGPAVENHLPELIAAGMDVARLNFSHGTHEEHAARLIALRAASAESGKSLSVLQDLCGPKIRIGTVEEGATLVPGKRFVLTQQTVLGSAAMVTLPIPQLHEAVGVGNRLLLDDGLLELVVREKTARDLITEVVIGGGLSSKKGICAPGVTLPLRALTPKDEDDVRFGLEKGVDYVALSFVQRAEDVVQLRQVMESCGRVVPIIVKIEKSDAVQNLDAILAVADGAMVARGDLGVEMPLEEVAIVQKQVIRACNRLGKLVITATQMLDSMIRNPRPTRAEVTDIANAVLDGTDALMLSGETAVGTYPIESAETMARVAKRTEQTLDYDRLLVEKHALFGTESVTDAVAEAAVSIAHDQRAAAILCATERGGTARAVAKFRPRTPILAATPLDTTCQQLALVWGVTPLRITPPTDTDTLIATSVQAATQAGLVKPGELIVITCGAPVGVAGSTNLIKVHQV